jgi:GDP-4-dehydro-6-deoxy-D-mannose reductase
MTGAVLVTGAAGFVGGHLLELLSRHETNVVGWRRPQGRPPHPFSGVRWMEVDVLDRAGVAAALAEVKPAAIYHLAGSAHVAQSWQYIRETYEGNLLATNYLFEGLRLHRLAPRVLVTGSAHVYAPQPRPLLEDDQLKPVSPYATSKLATEMLAMRAWTDDELPTILTRAFNHVGPGQDPSYVAPSIARQVALIEHGKLEPSLSMGNLESRRDFSDVRDTVRAYRILMASGRPGVPYNVSSGRAVAMGELVGAFVSRARCAVRVVQDQARFRPNDVPLLVGSHDRITAETGWKPEIPLEQTIDDLLAYWRARAASEA